MPVPGPKPRSVLLFGPFLYEAASGPFFERVLAQNRIGKGDAAALRTFYGTVPEVAEPTMAAAAHAVACQLYGAHDPARVVHRTLASTVTGPGATRTRRSSFPWSFWSGATAMKTRCWPPCPAAITTRPVRHLGRFSIKNFTPRTGELLRDVQKHAHRRQHAAAQGRGKRPRTSGVYRPALRRAAVKIERVADTVEANRLGLEMLRRYWPPGAQRRAQRLLPGRAENAQLHQPAPFRRAFAALHCGGAGLQRHVSLRPVQPGAR